MKTIWKFLILNDQELELPEDYEVLYVDKDNKDNLPCMWILFDTEKSKVKKRFVVGGTGWNFDHMLQYIGSWQEGPYVWHVGEYKIDEKVETPED